CSACLAVHRDSAGFAVLAIGDEDGIRAPVDVLPIGSESLANSNALPAEQYRDRLNVRRVRCDKPVCLLFAEKTHALIANLLAAWEFWRIKAFICCKIVDRSGEGRFEPLHSCG